MVLSLPSYLESLSLALSLSLSLSIYIYIYKIRYEMSLYTECVYEMDNQQKRIV